MQTMVANAGMALVRIGGGFYDLYGTDWNGSNETTNCYIAAIAAVKAVNSSAKFLIQVPFASGITYLQAKTMVANIKTKYQNDVFYYTIGNEWDAYINTSVTPNREYTAAEIATEIKNFASAMKSQDYTIKIVAPSLSSYSETDYNNQQIMPILISGNGGASDITGKDGNGRYYIDVVDFHTYAGGTNGDMSGISGNYSTWRSNSIAYPNGAFSTNLGSLQSLMSTANSNNRTNPSSPLTYAITELNIDWKNPPFTPGTDEGSTDPEKNTPLSLGPRSFFAGQYMADLFSAILKNGTPSANNKVEFSNPWSINESNGDGSSYDLSMTKGDINSCNDPAPQPISTYWHYKMMATNFTNPAAYFPNVSTAGAQSNYKAFACTTSTEIRVMLMNQNEQSPRGADNSTNTFKINFNGSTPTGADMLFAFSTGNTTTCSGGLQSGVYSCTITKETSMYLSFNKSTGCLISNKVYSLQDALRMIDVGPMTWVGGTENISNSTGYSAHSSTEVKADINIVPSGTLNAIEDKVFQFTNSAKIDGASGAFSSNGKALTITATSETTCH